MFFQGHDSNAPWSRYMFSLSVSVYWLFALGATQKVSADYTIYTLPGTPLQITLAGDAKYNPGAQCRMEDRFVERKT